MGQKEAGGPKRAGGKLMMEAGCGQAGAVEILLGTHGFRQLASYPDTRGVLRVVEGTWPALAGEEAAPLEGTDGSRLATDQAQKI